jgi:hypothetical protein
MLIVFYSSNTGVRTTFKAQRKSRSKKKVKIFLWGMWHSANGVGSTKTRGLTKLAPIPKTPLQGNRGGHVEIFPN